MKTTELLDCALIRVYAVIKPNTIVDIEKCTVSALKVENRSRYFNETSHKCTIS